VNCLKPTDEIPVKVRKIFLYKNGNIRINVGKLKILAYKFHTFMCFSKDNVRSIKAKDITLNDYLYLAVSLLKKGSVVMTDKGFRKVSSPKCRLSYGISGDAICSNCGKRNDEHE